MQVNELAFTQDGKLFLQATDSGVEVRPQSGLMAFDHVQIRIHNQEILNFWISWSLELKPLIPHA